MSTVKHFSEMMCFISYICCLSVQIRVPLHSPTACRSDSSGDSSEDDSTLVLLAPNSRSPSPKTGKHQHHRHRHRRSRSPAVPALPSKPLPALQGLSLSPRSKENEACSRSPCSAARKERLISPDAVQSPTLSPRSPVSPGSGVTAPEALIAALVGEHRPAQVSPPGVKPMGKTGEINNI